MSQVEIIVMLIQKVYFGTILAIFCKKWRQFDNLFSVIMNLRWPCMTQRETREYFPAYV